MTKGYSSVDEILDDILETLSPNFLSKIKEMTVDDFIIKQHFDLGLVIKKKIFL